MLLHSCCAPCSAAILEWMGQNGYEPTILFYNPNIFPEEEYLRRKNEIVRYAHETGVAIVDLDGGNAGGLWEQQHAQWLDCTVGLEGEPERGRRCLACFKHRLCVAATYAAEHGFPLFTTTLASSRWKDIRQISGTATGARADFTSGATSSPDSSTTSSTAAASSASATFSTTTVMNFNGYAMTAYTFQTQLIYVRHVHAENCSDTQLL